GMLPIVENIPQIIHQVCFSVAPGDELTIAEDFITDLSTSVFIDPDQYVTEFPSFMPFDIERTGLTPPLPQSDMVECPADAVPPTPPVVVDQCGNSVPAMLISVSDEAMPITCEGIRIYIFEYTDCSDFTTSWTYTYTIERTTEPAEVNGPVPFEDDVVGIENATAPTLPVVEDVCGLELDAVLVSVTDFPNPIICSGTREYLYRWTDCDNLTFEWTFTYTIDNMPEVICPANITVCHNEPAFTLTGGSPTGGTYAGAGVSMNMFSAFSAGLGTHTITYTYTNAQGCSDFCTFTIQVNPIPVIMCRPNAAVCIFEDPFIITGNAPSGGVYTGVGVTGNMFDPALAGLGPHLITYTVVGLNGCSNSCSFTFTVTNCPGDPEIEIILLDHCNPEQNGMCFDSTNCCENIVCYGIQYTPGHSGTLTTYTTGFLTSCVDGESPIDTNYSCVMTDNSFDIGECAVAPFQTLFNSSGFEGNVPITAGLPVVIHQVCFHITPGTTLTISEDFITDLTASIDLTGGSLVTEFPTFDEYMISRTGPVLPMNGFATVECVDDIVPPTPPVAFDQCCSEVIGTLTSSTFVPVPMTCGSQVFVYTYEDCGGAVSTWTFTYYIVHESGPSLAGMPVSTTTTIQCATQAGNHELPVVIDVCENVLTAPMPIISGTYTTCEGTITYTYNYVDCSGLPFQWIFTYIVDHTTAPSQIGGPVPIASNVYCNLDATPPTNLPVVKDFCGNTISPPVPTVGGSGTCGGTVTYTYVYVDCSGLPYTWVYTYTLECAAIQVKVFLEGPYDINTNLMRSDLNFHHLLPGQNKLLSPDFGVQVFAPYTPFGQPYTVAPWNYVGNLGLNYGDASSPGAPMGVIPYPLNVVDWILVTVRHNGLLPANNIWTCAGWVHRDGTVTFPENCGTPTI
ncbi:MAG: hypothetical protein M3R25_14695, partial [Bacteroidota bacterium]|nr:hypothetical protein [Bacteroidota bacterium]